MTDLQYSIIIPVYNANTTITRAVDSVLRQTVGGYEIIIVNDGSTDSSAELIDSLAEEHEQIKAIHQKNQGPNYARYNGIKNAKGKYILFLDADDIWDTNLLYNINKYNKDYDLILYNTKIVYGGNTIYPPPLFKITGNAGVIEKENAFRKTISTSDNNELWKKAFRRKLITEEMIADTFDLRTSEDLLLSVRMVQASETILYIDKYMYNHIDNPSGITNNIRLSDINDTLYVRSKIAEMIESDEDKELYSMQIEKRIAGMAVQICTSCKIKKKLELLKAIRENGIYKLIQYTDINNELSFLYRIVIKLLNGKKYYSLIAYSCAFLLFRKILRR